MADVDSDQDLVRRLVEYARISPSAVASRAGVAATTVLRAYNGTATSRFKMDTLDKLRAAFPHFEDWATPEPDLPPVANDIDYLSVDVLPTYAGMGGGGTGDGDPERALVPRYLIRDVFRGNPSDFVVIRTRGDSMLPDFRHDDELLIDKRDTSPTQPGPFAIWDAEWGEYVVKNVERLPGGRVRVFSSNGKYTPAEVLNEQTTILGRPVWFARRL